MTATVYRLLADVVLLIHFAFVSFVFFGLLTIWAGYFLKWNFVRNFWFRTAHLVCMAVVVAESVLGITCPLTIWEEKLRALAGGAATDPGSFIQRWVYKLMFFQLGEHVFMVIYVTFFAAIVLSLVVVPPRWPRHRQTNAARPG